MLPAVSVRELGKRYRVAKAAGPRGERQFGYRTLGDELTRLATLPLRMIRKGASAGYDDFWALDNVNFTIQRGEVVGIIGHNGAGKSTLLKILSRITKPTRGAVTLRGRVGSLLEVGTGFHPELTGRENIFLNGAILGMQRHEIQAKFDAIVEFAEIGPFLDTPVKRYSSGMYVRLAFAVAAHLEPEILIVDEVLAVGDMAFQRKCLGRMKEVGKSGATVLFVSHNMPAIETLCTRAILLDHGKVSKDGEVAEIVREYHARVLGSMAGGAIDLAERRDRDGEQVVLKSATLLDETGSPSPYMPLGGTFHLRIGFECPQPIDDPTIGLGFDDSLGQRMLTVHTPTRAAAVDRLDGTCFVDCRIERFPLAPGEYWLKIALTAKSQDVDVVERALHFTVADGDAFGEGRGFSRGVCVAASSWGKVGGHHRDTE